MLDALFSGDLKHKCNLARVDIRELSRMFLDYYAHYRRLPILDRKSDDQTVTDYLGILIARTDGRGNPSSEEIVRYNPGMIKFGKSLLGRRTINGMLADPWDEPYNIFVDSNSDGIVEIDRQYYLPGPVLEHYHVRIGGPIAIWSNGPNMKNDLGLGDDIASWNM